MQNSRSMNVKVLGERLNSYLSEPDLIDDIGLSATASLLEIATAPNATSEEVIYKSERHNLTNLQVKHQSCVALYMLTEYLTGCIKMNL